MAYLTMFLGLNRSLQGFVSMRWVKHQSIKDIRHHRKLWGASSGRKQPPPEQAQRTDQHIDNIHEGHCLPIIKEIDFNNPSLKNKTLFELLRGYFVFTACSFDIVVANQAKILKWTRTILGRKMFRYFMKGSIYSQFEGGENPEEVLLTARKLVASSVIPMFAYTAAEVHGTNNHQSLTQDYFNKNLTAMKQGLRIAAASKGCIEFAFSTPRMTGKVTFFISADALRKLSKIIKWNEFVIMGIYESGKEEDIRHVLHVIKNLEKVDISDKRLHSKANQLSFLGGYVHSAAHAISLYKELEVLTFTKGEKPVVDCMFEDEIYSGISMMKETAEEAINGGMKWVIDAEQTYLQPAIDAIVLDLMREYNRDTPAILNTYQCYLKRTLSIVKRDLAVSKRERFCFGGKIVRGAYMEEERMLSAKFSYEDPVNESYEATTTMYNEVVSVLLDAQKNREIPEVDLIIATHNAQTINDTIAQCTVKQVPLDSSGKNLIFAQLFGMRDHITYTLGAEGIPCAKLIHYGDVEEGLAYLSRRLFENRGGLSTPQLERRLLGKEIFKRVLNVSRIK